MSILSYFAVHGPGNAKLPGAHWPACYATCASVFSKATFLKQNHNPSIYDIHTILDRKVYLHLQGRAVESASAFRNCTSQLRSLSGSVASMPRASLFRTVCETTS